MNLNISRKELLILAKKVAKAAPSALVTPHLKGILLEANAAGSTVQLTATNLEVAIRAVMPANVENGGSVVIPADIFLGMLSRMESDEVHIKANSAAQIVLTGGTAAYNISVLPGERFPKIHMPMPGGSIFVTGLKSLIHKAVIASDPRPGPITSRDCVRLCFSEAGLTASAGGAYSVVQVAGDREATGNISLLVPPAPLKILAQLSQDSDVYELGVTGSGTAKTLVCCDGTLTFSARLAEGTAMDTERLFGSFVPETLVNMEAEALTAAIETISAIADAEDAVKLAFAPDSLALSCEASAGTSALKVAADVKNPLPKALYFRLGQLRSCIRALNGPVSLSFSKEGHLTIQTAALRYLQVASRPRVKAVPKPKVLKEAAPKTKPPKTKKPKAAA